MSKKTCKSDKSKKIKKAKYQCKNCEEIALKEKHLCKPKKLKEK